MVARRRWAAGGVAAFLIALSSVVVASPAGATITTNTIGCSGSAEITPESGAPYTVDAQDSTLKVPRNGSAAWTGSLGTITHNHKGKVTLEVGFLSLEVGSWGPTANTSNLGSRSGVKEIPSFMDQIPAGEYVLRGSHSGDEGSCAGHMTVDVEGSPWSNPVGLVVLAGTVLSGATMVMAARARPLH